jgi:hypothetical protein
MIILAISFAIAGFNRTNDVLTTEEQTSLKELLNNTYITSNGCLDAKCFTDNYVNPHIEHVFFSTSEGVVTCQSVNTQEIDVGDTLVVTPLSLSISNILTLSSDGIVSSNLFQMEASMSVSGTFEVGQLTMSERLALVPQNGTIVYDSTIGVLSIYQSGAWFLVSGVSGVVSISSTTLAITGTNTDPIIDLAPSGIVAGTYQAPTITFNTYGIATNVSASTVVLGISSSTLTIGGTVSNPTVNLTPSGIVSGSYQFPTVTFNTYGIATSAIQNTLTGTTNQINVTSFPNPIISLSSTFVNTVNGKVDRSGDTMTGPLNSSFIGSASTPNFSINSSNGIFQSSPNYLSFTTNGANRLDIDNTGKIFIKSLSTGVVHSDIDGLLSSSLVTNSEIETQTSLNTANYIVTRDASGNFAANMIKLTVGMTLAPDDVATKNYVDTAVNLGLSVKQPVVAVCVDSHISDPPTGSQTIDSVSVTTGNRVLLIAQGNPINNGAWVVQVGVWTRPSDFNTGTDAGAAYFLVQMGTVYTGSSWVCSTPMAVIGTNPLVFSQFSSPQSATGHNDAPTDGLVYNNSIGSTLHFRSLLNDVNGYLTMTNTTTSVQFAINAASGGGGNNIVARDGSGKFSANSINLSGGLIVSTGSAISPSVQVGPVSTGLSSAAGNLQLSTAFGIGVSIASATGVISLPSLTTLGVVHNSASGVLSTSLIFDADVDPNAAIVDTKLATISTVGKVSNTATTASSSLGGNTIVLRDGSNNFAAGTITASLTGSASLNVLKSGDTMTGNLILPNGSFLIPSLQVGSSTVGLSASAGILQLSTAFGIGLSIASATGIVSVPTLTTLGIVHNSSAGVLTTSLIVNADVSASAAIVDTKLATISTAGKVSNTATTATASAATNNTIVLRDGSGNFATSGIITSNNLISKTLDNPANADLALGGTNATTVTIGRSASVTTVLGNFVCPVPHGSLYNIATPSLVLPSGVFTPLSGTSTTGVLVQFVGGSLLQYTGTRTRTFRISCMLSYTAPASGTALTFGFGVNGTIGSGLIFQTMNSSNPGLILNICVVDFVVLANLDNVDLMIRSVPGSTLTNVFANINIEAILD